MRKFFFRFFLLIPLFFFTTAASNTITGGGCNAGTNTSPSLSSLTITPTDQTVLINSTKQYSATAHFLDNTTADVTSLVTWTSSNTNFVSINSEGLATAGNSETSAPITITASLDSISGSTAVSVVDLTPAVNQVSPMEGPLEGGTSVTITGLNFTNASAVTFGSTAATSFTVNSSTSITAISPAESAGTVDITVTTPYGTSAVNSSDQFTYIAAPTVTHVALNFGPTAGGTTVTLTGTGFTTVTSVQFGSVEATSFTIDSDTQITTVTPAHAAGIVDVAVSNIVGNGIDGNAFTYTDATLTSIIVLPVSPRLPQNYSQPFTALGIFSDASTLDLTHVANWTSSDQSVATISNTGLANGVAPGTTQISAQVNSILGVTTLTVTDAMLVSITIAPSNPAVPQGSTLQLSALGTFSDGSTLDLTDVAAWSSSDIGVATVSNTGLATGVDGGLSAISAEVNSISGNTILSVGI